MLSDQKTPVFFIHQKNHEKLTKSGGWGATLTVSLTVNCPFFWRLPSLSTCKMGDEASLTLITAVSCRRQLKQLIVCACKLCVPSPKFNFSSATSWSWVKMKMRSQGWIENERMKSFIKVVGLTCPSRKGIGLEMYKMSMCRDGWLHGSCLKSLAPYKSGSDQGRTNWKEGKVPKKKMTLISVSWSAVFLGSTSTCSTKLLSKLSLYLNEFPPSNESFSE